jgi:adenine-specific DNA-methyltransferase
MEPSQMTGQSMNSQAALLAKLMKEMPEIFSEGKIDTKKLKATLGEDVVTDQERYSLTWAGKAECFKKIQETTTNTLKPCRDESVDFDKTENLFIEGDNLQVLKVLQKSYYGKVKMIYIDPPYNTGNDFIYNDKFSRTKKEELVANGSIDEEGNVINHDLYRQNTRDSGHFHSNWLNMMYPRLFLARNLLRQDGVIFVSIDDNEVKNLRAMMDEIFGEENFIIEIVWEKRFTRSNNAKKFATLTERILLYRRSDSLEEISEPRDQKADSTYSNPDNDPRGDWTSVSYVNPASKEQRPNLSYGLVNPSNGKTIVHPTNAWKFSKETHLKHVEENRLYWGKNGENTYPRLKRFLSEMEDGMVPVDLWSHESTGTTDQASKDLLALMEKKVFDFPKPIGLIGKMLKLVTEKDSNDIILDFFAGSGTTAHAVMQLNAEDGGNRKWICVQLPEKCKEESEAAKAGFTTIADIAKERIQRAGKKIKEEVSGKLGYLNGLREVYGHKEREIKEVQGDMEKPAYNFDLGFKAFKLDESNFKVWNTQIKDVEQLEQQLIDFIDNVRPESTHEDMLYELILKSGLELNITIEEKQANGAKYHRIGDGSLIICLADKLTKPLFEAILKDKPEKVITLDRAFANNDQLKTNMMLEAEHAGVKEFKVI